LPNFWIFVVTSHQEDGKVLDSKEIYQTRMRDKFWGIGKGTPNRKRLRKGDQVVFYLGGREKVFFAGEAELASGLYALDPQRRTALGHGMKYFTTEHGVDLTKIETWDEPHYLDSGLIAKLHFISNKEKWGVHFAGGVKAISRDDFEIILNPSKRAREEGIESPGEFELEKYLHEFIVSNFEKINFGSKLEIYQDEDGQKGSGYPTSAGYIDILCRDRNAGDFVVIELKKGMTTDSVIGQTLRYIGWVRENLAKDRSVKGLIIAKEFDDKLRYALPKDPEIQVRTYEIEFRLNKPSGKATS